MESTGARLKKIRLEKGLSLDEAHKKTKIDLNVLKAIEEDSLVGLSPVYIKGFLKIYCRFLGVQPQEYIPDYHEPRQSPLAAGSRGDRRKSELTILKPDRKIIKTAVIVIAVIGTAVLLFNLGRKISSRKQETLPRDVKPKAVLAESAKPKPAKAGIKPASQIRLVIGVREDCYVHVKTDGHTVFQGNLKKGRPEAWMAKEKIELSLGNAGVVDLEVNGQAFSNLGRKGQPLKSILIDKEGLNIKK